MAWQPARALSATTPGAEAREPDVALDGQGDAAAAWSAFNGGFYLAEAAGFDAAGPAIGALSIPSSGGAGQTLAFSVSAADVWSPLGATTWSFGDGQSASGTGVTHAYAKAGSYNVTVSTADVLGNATTAGGVVPISGTPATTAPGIPAAQPDGRPPDPHALPRRQAAHRRLGGASGRAAARHRASASR